MIRSALPDHLSRHEFFTRLQVSTTSVSQSLIPSHDSRIIFAAWSVTDLTVINETTGLGTSSLNRFCCCGSSRGRQLLCGSFHGLSLLLSSHNASGCCFCNLASFCSQSLWSFCRDAWEAATHFCHGDDCRAMKLNSNKFAMFSQCELFVRQNQNDAVNPDP